MRLSSVERTAGPARAARPPRPRRNGFAGGPHGFTQARSAGRTELVGNRHDRRERRLDHIEAVFHNALGAYHALAHLEVAHERDHGQLHELRNPAAYDAGVPIGRLPAGEHEVAITQLADCRGENAGRAVGIAILEGGVGEQHAVIGPHGKAMLEDRARRLRPKGHDADPRLASGIPDAQRRFERLFIERAHDHLQARGREHLLRLLVDLEHAEGRLGIRHLLYANNDVHA
jgi:hypothetical protein